MAAMKEKIEAAKQRAEAQAKKAAEARKRVAQLKAQEERIEARKLAQTLTGNRAADTRRKILVGAAILAKVERGEWPKEKLLQMLDSFLTRPDERALFELGDQPQAQAQ